MNKYKFPIHWNAKNPLCRWSDPSNWVKEDIYSNYALPTGTINNLTVIDFDTYKDIWTDDHPFYKEFGKDFVKTFNTYTVRTASDGYHLYFQYDPCIKTTTCQSLQIDTRNDGGYVIGNGSCFSNKYYETIHDTTIKKMPDNLRTWLLDNLYKPTHVSVNNDVTTRKNMMYTNTPESAYNYLIPRDDIEYIIQQLPPKYMSNFTDWLIFTTFCKILNVQDLWDKYSKTHSSYNQENNKKYWYDINKGTHYSIVEFILKEVGLYDRLPYYKLKMEPVDVVKPNYYINEQKLGYKFFNSKPNIVVKSDTCTGKTTSFKHFIKLQSDKFVSIVSRKSLAQEQYKIFSEHEITCRLYSNEVVLDPQHSVIVQLESLRRISNFDFSNRIVFIDEFNSVIKHLLTSPTIAKQRVFAFRLFLRILKEAKQIICVDADISDMCFKLLDRIFVKYSYYINQHQHTKGIRASEFKNREELLDKLSKEDKFILVCDSKKESKIIHLELMKRNPDKYIKIYTADTPSDEDINLDDHDRVIFSPKIIYGLDSIMERAVYCIYRGSSISPEHMVQQINRCRNITYINYLFLSKKINEAKYTNMKSCFNDLQNKLNCNITEFKEVATTSENQLYLELLVHCTYVDDCYNTNKFLHFKNILRSRGIIDVNLYYTKPQSYQSVSSKVITEMDRKNFSPNDPRVKDINAYLCVPKKEIEKYVDHFISDFRLKYHFNISYYFFSDADVFKEEIASIKDFKINYITSCVSKLAYLKNLTSIICLNTDNNDKFYIKYTLTAKQNEKFVNDYTAIFNGRDKKPLNFRDNKLLLKKIIVMYKTLFGNSIIQTKRISDSGGKNTHYFINSTFLDFEKSLYSKRHTLIPVGCALDCD